jgi:hypothetical protein
MATSPYQYYNQILNAWPTAIAPESQWFVVIDFKDVGVIQNSFNKINNFDNTSNSGNTSNSYWNLPSETVKNLISYNNQTSDNLVGCVFAREVTVPSEGVDITNRGLSYGGYQAPATANTRDKYKKFTISFNETNSSFLDFVIRPWIINVGYFGLIARDGGDRSVKSSFVDIVYLGRTGPYPNPSIRRKIFRFFSVVPTNVIGFTNQYQTEGLQYAKVEFAYDYYTVLDSTNGSQLNA